MRSKVSNGVTFKPTPTPAGNRDKSKPYKIKQYCEGTLPFYTLISSVNSLVCLVAKVLFNDGFSMARRSRNIEKLFKKLGQNYS